MLLLPRIKPAALDERQLPVYLVYTADDADAFASATAFTGMWLMAKKKVESWYWWIATNIASIPLYFVKGLVFTSVYYLILLVMAIFGLIEWIKRAREEKVKVATI